MWLTLMGSGSLIGTCPERFSPFSRPVGKSLPSHRPPFDLLRFYRCLTTFKTLEPPTFCRKRERSTRGTAGPHALNAGPSLTEVAPTFLKSSLSLRKDFGADIECKGRDAYGSR